MNPSRTLSISLFLLGLIFAALVTAALFWGPMEAFFYFSSDQGGSQPLKTLDCPRVLAADEPGAIRVTIVNKADQQMNTAILLDIARPGLMRSERVDLQIPPRQTQISEWKIDQQDVTFRRLVLAQVYTYRAINEPSRQGTCGVLVLPVRGIPGALVMYTAIALSLGLLAAGVWLWRRQPVLQNARQSSVQRGAGLLALAVLIGLAASFLGWWAVGLAAFLLTLLLGVILAAYLAQS
jgi:hypothetical protein